MDRERTIDTMVLSMRVGEVMLGSSVATSDVEEAIRRTLAALGLGRCEVSVTLNTITLCYLQRGYEPITLIRVVELDDPRFDRLAALEELVGRLEGGDLSLLEAAEELERLAAQPPHPRRVTFVAALVSVSAWVLFAGGGIVGAIAAVLAATLIEVAVAPLARTRVPAVFALVAAAAVVVAVPYGFAWIGLPIALTAAVVGGLYPLLPGGALVASVTDGIRGAPISSLAKGLQAALSAAAIAVSALSVLALAEVLEIGNPQERSPMEIPLVMLCGGVAVAALGVSRSLPVRFVLPVAVLAMVAWLVPGALPDALPARGAAVFTAATIIGIGAQLAARLWKTSSTLFTATAVFVLVPGVALYSAMVAFAQGDPDLGVELTAEALGVAAAIAAGMALGVAVGRSVPTPRPALAKIRQIGYDSRRRR